MNKTQLNKAAVKSWFPTDQLNELNGIGDIVMASVS